MCLCVSLFLPKLFLHTPHTNTTHHTNTHTYTPHLSHTAVYSHIQPLSLSLSNTLSTLYHNRLEFGEIIIEHKTSVLIFSTMFVWNISITKWTWRGYTINVDRSTLKQLLFLSDFNWNLNFLTDLRNIPNLKFLENFSVGRYVLQCGKKESEAHDDAEANS
jgi:hypothetical protein